MRARVEFVVNGVKRQVEGDPRRSLLEVLRTDLDLTGTKYGCGEGQCGACTVHVDGRARRACLTSVGTIGGKEVRTIEGLARDGKLHPVQQAFLDAGAFQCGFCTPGMIMAAAAEAEANPASTAADFGRALDGNLCRCGTHPRILEALAKIGRKPEGGPR